MPRVAVRALCAFAARCGDLDHRFTPSPSAQEGIAGHGTVTARRGAGYQREVPLSGACAGLWLQGRADGLERAARRLEEIKTHRGDPALIADNQRALHWAQARVYGWLLCSAEGWDTVDIALVYFNIDTGVETPVVQRCSAGQLLDFTQALCDAFRAWALQERAHRAARDEQLSALAFPFDGFRQGQRDLAEAVFRTQRAGRHLLAQAPTGIGKTVATVFAALRAMPAAQSEQLLYLTPKTTGRALALDALKRLGVGPLRVLERVAREKACEHPDKACHGDVCPLARGFYDRLGAARQAAAQARWLDRAALREIALAHGICPYYLSQEMQRWADVVVGDVNHFFDLSAQAFALAQSQDWRVQLLVDEAHNLIERARAMYSAELDPRAFGAVRAQAPAALRPGMDRLHRAWGKASIALKGRSTLLDQLPEGFTDALRTHTGALSDHIAQHPESAGLLQGWLFDALHWLRVAERFGDHSVVELTESASASRGRQRARIAIRCLVPAPLLTARWAGAHSATLFSATLAPFDHVQRLLGLPEDTARTAVASPFTTDQLSVRVVGGLSTRWADRQRSLGQLVEAMASTWRQTPGNHLAFFSSFDYLQQALQAFTEAHPDVPVWAQSRAMDEPARDAFIARFVEGGQGIGFAVLGGAFGEGIDLPGTRLVGAFIATLGMPPADALNEALRERLQALGGRGWEDTYLTPGLRKVVQAAGRVIRTPHDRGVLVLLDERFQRPQVRALLPDWWWPRATTSGDRSP